MKFSCQQEASNKSSSQETDQSEQNYNDSLIAGTGRSYYECVFCKRGFTTAQALGGHMNIHRKDKAKIKPSSSPSKVTDSDLRFYSAIESHPAARNYYCATAPDDQVQVHVNYNYHPIYFGPPTWALRSASQLTQCGENQRVRDLFGEEYWRKGLSFYTNIPLCVKHETEGKLVQDSCEEDGGLDLELRLGYI